MKQFNFQILDERPAYRDNPSRRIVLILEETSFDFY